MSEDGGCFQLWEMLSQGKVINLLPDELSTELCKYSEKNVCDQVMKYFKFYFTV